MTTQVKAIPDGYEHATPYLCCKNAAEALDFYHQAFGALETMRLSEPGGRIGHAEMTIGKAQIMISDEYADMGVLSPESLGGSPVLIHLYVADVDAVVARAAAAGATVTRPPADQFYGDRSASLVDPFGHRWMIATRKEEVSAEEMQRRYDDILKA